MVLKLQDMTADEREKVLTVLLNSFYARLREMFLTYEHEIARFDPSKKKSYGETVMDGNDRLNNRLMASLILTDNGIPPHDLEALEWVADVLKAAQGGETEAGGS